MEILVACTLDCVATIAILDGVSIPDPEDASLNPRTAPAYRIARWKIFALWYAGGEGLNLKPGFGTPSHARVLVSERWETRQPKLRSALLKVKWQAEREADNPVDDEGEGEGPDYLEDLKEFKRIWGNQQNTRRDLIPGFFESILNTGLGRALRRNLLQETLCAVQDSRRFSMLRMLWPAATTSRLSLQFMFPRIGICFPHLVFPSRRIRLFPSRTKYAYTLREIESW